MCYRGEKLRPADSSAYTVQLGAGFVTSSKGRQALMLIRPISASMCCATCCQICCAATEPAALLVTSRKERTLLAGVLPFPGALRKHLASGPPSNVCGQVHRHRSKLQNKDGVFKAELPYTARQETFSLIPTRCGSVVSFCGHEGKPATWVPLKRLL